MLRFSQVISPRQMQKGFVNVVNALDDLALDVPDAPSLAAAFIARAVVDDILPPSFVGKLSVGAPVDGLLLRTLERMHRQYTCTCADA